jgi:intracellular septation protein
MKSFIHAGKFLVLDMLSTVFFLTLYLVTKNILLSVAIGMALGVAQIGMQFARRKPIDTMQWLSLFLVMASGTATFLTHDARFVLIKPSIIYVIVGVVMLKRGWMNRYLPPIAMELVPDIATAFGYVWAGLMFFSAGLNLFMALKFGQQGLVTYASIMSIYAMASKIGLFLIQFATMRIIGGQRRRAQEAMAGAGAVAA